MKENAVYPKFKAAVKETLPDCVAHKIPGSTFQKGMPDFLVNVQGLLAWVEIKLRKKGKPRSAWTPSPEQARYLEEANRIVSGSGLCLIYDADMQKWFFLDDENTFFKQDALKSALTARWRVLLRGRGVPIRVVKSLPRQEPGEDKIPTLLL